MGFDQNDPKPMTVTAHKKTTKVNIGVVTGVIVFLTLAVAVLLWLRFNTAINSSDLHEKMTESPQPAAPR